MESIASLPTAKPMREWHDVDLACFRDEIVPLNEPVILRGLVAHWHSVTLAKRDPGLLCRHLSQLDNGLPVDAILLHPDESGHIFYNPTLDGFNFLRKELPIAAIIERLVYYSGYEVTPALAAQSALIHECLPDLLAELDNPVLENNAPPRIWIGNRLVVPTHFDTSSNIACCISGERRFTVFPPTQIGNLYMGPLDFAPTKMPISLVNVQAPDLQRFPRYAEALEQALVADLTPGDAIYMPPLWLHNVESRQDFNVLINYWWKESTDDDRPNLSNLDNLLRCMLELKYANQQERQAWKALFEHFVFNDSDPAGHLAGTQKGILGPLDDNALAALKSMLKYN